ncbi:N-acetyltransferase [Lactonifactor longoviformis]|uniref:Protein N-acetyltransferase, RimJ/RimL family n=1 Tax=Lactonifactor longoviformis DSM 17459 TaxID=1122155 RepID=A0A1M5C7K6_9CLOT|nr:GNAT family N-acetyltransferase [Lactonifactor longoviformis]POP33872.1 N-acetyltransferase [Lactonifactor longoviformis]SHF50729.1 Protein N-acetyltransferase, RimJ/RimL family [Lactonifactor longoviformis DSM 17459]
MTEADIPVLWKMYQEPEVADWGCRMKESEEEELEAFPSYREYMYHLCDMGFWTVIKKDTGEIIGQVGFEPGRQEEDGIMGIEMGYMIGPSFQGKGYGWEACRIAIEAARDREIKELFCRIDRRNQASEALARKLGFTKEGELWKKEILTS